MSSVVISTARKVCVVASINKSSALLSQCSLNWVQPIEMMATLSLIPFDAIVIPLLNVLDGLSKSNYEVRLR